MAAVAIRGPNCRQKSRARLASPQPRPASPVNGAGGMTGCRDDAEAHGIVPDRYVFFLHGLVMEFF